MLLWVVSGAKRKVGKTHLAKRLCAVLPDSVYAKLGHGFPAGGKSQNFFSAPEDLRRFIENECAQKLHAVIESNSASITALKTIRIFVGDDGGPGEPRLDTPQLHKSADIRIVSGASTASWRNVVLDAVADVQIAEAVLSELLAHKRWIERTAVAVHSKVWLVNRELEHVFGPGLADLLADIEHLGSLKAAALRNGVSYRQAWGALRSAEKHLGVALVKTYSGGPSGGHTEITDAAKRVLAKFVTLSQRVSAFADSEFAKLNFAEGGTRDD